MKEITLTPIMVLDEDQIAAIHDLIMLALAGIASVGDEVSESFHTHVLSCISSMLTPPLDGMLLLTLLRAYRKPDAAMQSRALAIARLAGSEDELIRLSRDPAMIVLLGAIDRAVQNGADSTRRTLHIVISSDNDDSVFAPGSDKVQ